MQRSRCGPAQLFAIQPGMSESRPPALPKDLALEGGEHSQQRGHCATSRCGQVQRLGQRYEADAEMFQFLHPTTPKTGGLGTPASTPPRQKRAGWGPRPAAWPADR